MQLGSTHVHFCAMEPVGMQRRMLAVGEAVRPGFEVSINRAGRIDCIPGVGVGTMEEAVEQALGVQLSC
jgi:hypothetical protein